MEFLEIIFSRHGTCKLQYDTSLALARSSLTRRYTGITSGVTKMPTGQNAHQRCDSPSLNSSKKKIKKKLFEKKII